MGQKNFIDRLKKTRPKSAMDFIGRVNNDLRYFIFIHIKKNFSVVSFAFLAALRDL